MDWKPVAAALHQHCAHQERNSPKKCEHRVSRTPWKLASAGVWSAALVILSSRGGWQQSGLSPERTRWIRLLMEVQARVCACAFVVFFIPVLPCLLCAVHSRAAALWTCVASLSGVPSCRLGLCLVHSLTVARWAGVPVGCVTEVQLRVVPLLLARPWVDYHVIFNALNLRDGARVYVVDVCRDSRLHSGRSGFETMTLSWCVFFVFTLLKTYLSEKIHHKSRNYCTGFASVRSEDLILLRRPLFHWTKTPVEQRSK